MVFTSHQGMSAGRDQKLRHCIQYRITQLIHKQIQPGTHVKVGEAVLPLHLLNPETNFPVCFALVLQRSETLARARNEEQPALMSTKICKLPGEETYRLKISQRDLKDTPLQPISCKLHSHQRGCSTDEHCKLHCPQANSKVGEALQVTFVPCDRVTKVLPTLRLVNMLGALTSYQSFLEKGSTLKRHKTRSESKLCCANANHSRGGSSCDLHLLLATLLAFRDPLVLADGHIVSRLCSNSQWTHTNCAQLVGDQAAPV